jgi:gluconolactonase
MYGFVFQALGTAGAILVLALPAFAQSGISGVVAPDVEAELVQDGYVFTEGPVGAPGGGLYFTDNRANTILLLDPSGKISVTHENTTNANGLVLTKEGDILAAEGVGKRISKRSKSGGAGVTLTDSFDGKPFMAPNDLFVDARGGIYFTDPGPRPVVPGRKTFVYYLAPGAKEPIVIDDQLGRPNGVILTADGKTLLVNDSLVEAFFAYDVEPSGAVKNKREFAKLRDIATGKESGADGFAIDTAGRVYVASVPGVQVFDAKGGYLGTIKTPKQSSNVGFAGPDRRVLYMTAREGLYRIKTLAQGVDRPAGK